MREEGAWWMAGMCWAVGWAAAGQVAWPPLLLAIGTASGLIAAEAARMARMTWPHERARSWRRLGLAGLALLLGAPWVLFVLDRVPVEPRFLLLTLPSLAYAGTIAARCERHPASRVGGIAALTALAPLAHASAAGSFTEESWALWFAMGGCFLLGSLLVMARFRRSRAMLWLVRIAAPLAGAAFLVVCDPGIAAATFLIPAVRAWTFDPSAPAVPPNEVGRLELTYSLLASLLVLAAIVAR